MTDDVKAVKDETESFETTSSDMPIIEEPVHDETEPLAKAENDQAYEPESTDKKEVVTGDDTAAELTADKPDKGKKQRSAQKRIDKVVRERENANRRAEAAEKRIAELENKETEESIKAPEEDDFDTYDEYLDALDKHDKAAAKPEKAEPKQDTSQDEVVMTDSQRTALALVKDKVDQDSEQYEDFDKVALNPDLRISGEMLEALAECDDPTKVMYHLGQNQDLAAQISELSPAQQMREIAKLDLTGNNAPEKPTKTTQTADPISPVAGSDAQEKAVDKMSFSEYEAKMNKREAQGSGY